MRKIMMHLVVLALLSGMAMSQAPNVARQTGDGSIDFSGRTTTRPNKVGAELPATCVVGETFQLTTAPAGQQYRVCTATNTWTTQGGAAAWGAITGTLSEQTDLQSELNGKAASIHTHGVADLTATGTPSATTYLRGDNVWATPAGGGGAPFDNGGTLLEDEFFRNSGAAIGELGWVSTGTINNFVGGLSLTRPGIVRLDTTAVANNSANIRPNSLDQNGIHPTSLYQLTGLEWRTWIRLPTTTDVRVRIGMQATTTGGTTPPHGAYLEYDTSLGHTTWQCVLGAGAARQMVNTGVAVTPNTWTKLSGFVDETGFRCRVGSTETAAVSTASAPVWIPRFAWLIDTLVGEVRSLHIDTFQMWIPDAR